MSYLGKLKGRWHGATQGSTNQRLFAATALVGVIGLFVKVVSLGRDSVAAGYFGRSDPWDAYLTAFLVPMTVGGIISGSLNQTLIPTYVQVRDKQGHSAAEKLFSSMLIWNTIGLLILSLLLLLTDRIWLPILASGYSESKLELTRHLLRWTMPMVVVTGLSTTWGAVLNAGEKFGVVAIGPIMQPITTIGLVVLFAHSIGIYTMAFGVLLGSIFEAMLVGISLHRRKHALLPRWHGMTPAVRQVRAQYFACIAGAIVLSGTTIVDTGFAASLGPGSVSSLGYGTKIPVVMIGLMLTAVGTASLPIFSKLVADKDWGGLRHSLKSSIRLLAISSVAVSAILIALSPLIIRILFQHGHFTADDTLRVVPIQRWALMGVPFAIVLSPVTRTFVALRANYIMSIVSVGSLILNAIADYLFMKWFGLPGIVMATLVWMGFVFITLFSILYFYLLPRAEKESGEHPAPM